jgi:cob(I)alamin adenosyltransferase
MAIDNPYDAIDKVYRDDSDQILSKVLDVFGHFEALTGAVNVIRKQFSKDATIARILALLEQLVADVQKHGRKMTDFNEKMDSPEFAETIIAAVNESIRTTSLEKVGRFARILGHSLSSTRNVLWDEAAAFIRDLAQLTERDVEVLNILYSIQKNLFLGRSNSLDPNSYTEKNNEVLDLVHQSGISRDEFYSRCGRLNGFGLAIEVQRNPSRVSNSDHCFRLTTRGRELIAILSS